MDWLPGLKLDVVNTALPAVKGTVAKGLPESENTTEPVGITEFDGELIVAVSSTEAP
jgi:hypothetical protein